MVEFVEPYQWLIYRLEVNAGSFWIDIMFYGLHSSCDFLSRYQCEKSTYLLGQLKAVSSGIGRRRLSWLDHSIRLFAWLHVSMTYQLLGGCGFRVCLLRVWWRVLRLLWVLRSGVAVWRLMTFYSVDPTLRYDPRRINVFVNGNHWCDGSGTRWLGTI